MMYTYGTGIDEVLSLEREGIKYFLHHDALGSSIALTRWATGAVSETYEYTPFGEVTIQDLDGNNLVGNPFLFAGGFRDKETGLYHMRARSYVPEMGRFASRDSIGLWGDANNWGNPYAYGGNNPYSGHDPSGQLWDFIVDAVSVVVSAVEFIANPSVETGLTLATDIVAAVVPFVPSPTSAKMIVKAGNAVADTLKGADKAKDAGKAAAKAIPSGTPKPSASAAKSAGGAPTPAPKPKAEPVGAANGKNELGSTAATDEGVIYKRTNPETGEEYVGQAKSPERFEARQGEHDRAHGVEHEYEILDRGTPGRDLDVKEEGAIRREGGLKKEGGKLENKRHEMSEKRYREGGGTVKDPTKKK